MTCYKRTYPKGYKQFRILQKLNTHPMTYTGIIKMAYEMEYGEGSFDPVRNRGYWSGAFKRPGSLPWSNKKYGWISSNTRKGVRLYSLNDNGIRLLNKLGKKFGHLTDESAQLLKNMRDAGKEINDETLGLSFDEPDDPEIGHDEYLRDSGLLKSFDEPVYEKPERVVCSNGLSFDEKPPVGIVPLSTFKEQLYKDAMPGRLEDLKRAITSYVNKNLSVPKEWMDEYEYIAEQTRLSN